MRQYADPVEVRQGRLDDGSGTALEGPEQFLWRGRLWKVRAVVAHWVETGPWWQSGAARAVVGTEPGDDQAVSPGEAALRRTSRLPLGDLLTERELWRVEAGQGRADLGGGVFDLSFDWAEGRWTLVACAD